MAEDFSAFGVGCMIQTLDAEKIVPCLWKAGDLVCGVLAVVDTEADG